MLEDLAIPSKPSPCRIRTIKEGMSASDAKILDEAVMNEAWPKLILSRELKKRGVEVSDKVIGCLS